MFLEPRAVCDIAFIGWGRRPADETCITIYDWHRLTEAISHWLDCTFEDATEFVSSNIEGAWHGPNTPLIIQRGSPYDLEQLL